MSRERCVGAVVVACALTVAGGAFADRYFVPDDFDTIQEAIDAVADGDEIGVRPGTYPEAIDLIGKAIRLYGTEGRDVTTIDATGLGASVVTCTTGEGPATVLEGFTVTGGAPSDQDAGGGLYVGSASPTILDCVFVGNTARHGGGLHLRDSQAVVRGCRFVGNAAAYGAGVRVHSGGPTLIACVLEGNVGSYGGGIHIVVSEPTLIACTVRGNTAEQGGGSLSFASSPMLVHCLYTGNESPWGSAVYQIEGGRPRVLGCAIIDNTAAEYGSSMYTGDECEAVVSNCIIWNGAQREIIDQSGGVTHVTYCDVYGGYEGVGNIDADPLCVDPEHGDYRLGPGSPCVDAGANNAVPADAFDLDDDGDRGERVPLDLDGLARFADDPDTEDTGCGVPVIVDLGPFEYPGLPVERIRLGDVDGNGIVDFGDILGVLGAWGDCDPACCLADQDFSWRVDVADILVILANWG